MLEDAGKVLHELKEIANEDGVTGKRKRETNKTYEMLGVALTQSAETLKVACQHVNPLPDSSVDRAIKRLKNAERSVYAINKPTSPTDKIKEFISLSADDDD